MKIKCVVEYQIKDDKSKDPYPIKLYEAHAFMNEGFEHQVRLLICRVNRKGEEVETLKASDWFKRTFINQQTYIHYAGLSFVYHHNSSEITICDTILKI